MKLHLVEPADGLTQLERELAALEDDMRGYQPKHRNCGGACHVCPDMDGGIMPGCYGGMENLAGCYCRPEKMRVQHPKCPSCKCAALDASQSSLGKEGETE